MLLYFHPWSTCYEIVSRCYKGLITVNKVLSEWMESKLETVFYQIWLNNSHFQFVHAWEWIAAPIGTAYGQVYSFEVWNKDYLYHSCNWDSVWNDSTHLSFPGCVSRVCVHTRWHAFDFLCMSVRGCDCITGGDSPPVVWSELIYVMHGLRSCCGSQWQSYRTWQGQPNKSWASGPHECL